MQHTLREGPNGSMTASARAFWQGFDRHPWQACSGTEYARQPQQPAPHLSYGEDEEAHCGASSAAPSHVAFAGTDDQHTRTWVPRRLLSQVHDLQQQPLAPDARMGLEAQHQRLKTQLWRLAEACCGDEGACEAQGCWSDAATGLHEVVGDWAEQEPTEGVSYHSPYPPSPLALNDSGCMADACQSSGAAEVLGAEDFNLGMPHLHHMHARPRTSYDWELSHLLRRSSTAGPDRVPLSARESARPWEACAVDCGVELQWGLMEGSSMWAPARVGSGLDVDGMQPWGLDDSLSASHADAPDTWFEPEHSPLPVPDLLLTHGSEPQTDAMFKPERVQCRSCLWLGL